MEYDENQRLWTEVIELSERKVRYFIWHKQKFQYMGYYYSSFLCTGFIGIYILQRSADTLVYYFVFASNIANTRIHWRYAMRAWWQNLSHASETRNV